MLMLQLSFPNIIAKLSTGFVVSLLQQGHC